MAAKKRKKKKKTHIFVMTLMLTISVGCAVMFGSWVLFETDDAHQVSVNIEETQNAGQNAAADNAGSADEIVDTEGNNMASETENPTEAAVTEENPVADAMPGRYDALLADEELCRKLNVYAKETSDSDRVSLVFAGDILFDDEYAVMASTLARGRGIEGSISQDLLRVMREADIFMVNNEFTYTDRGEPTPDKMYTFRAEPKYASWLHDMGADIVSLANNHTYDYGEISLLDTLDTLAEIGMPYVGAGRNLEEAAKPVYFIANDLKIAIVSATQIERMNNPSTIGATEDSPGVFRCLNIDNLLQTIREADENSDFVIVYIHWGTESTDEIDWAQIDQGPRIAEAGADLIIGDHPHVLQPIDYISGVPVVYSLGNFLFNSRAMDTCLVRAVLNEKGLESLQFIPARQENCSVAMQYDLEKERILSYMRSISPGINIDEDGYITKAR